MFSENQYIDSIKFETNVCIHLHSKTSKEIQDYRPTEGQRSVLELLQYLTTCVQTPIRCLISQDWSKAPEYLEEIKKIGFDDYCNAMNSQVKEAEELLCGFTEDDYTTKMAMLPTGQEVVLGAALVNFPLKFITAYRMQLFLYLKANGKDKLNTMNCWFGMDQPNIDLNQD